MSNKLSILDICFGIGYNSASIFEELIDTPTEIQWIGLEIDTRPLNIALNSQRFKRLWSKDVISILTSINQSGKWKEGKSSGRIFWGDARKNINLLPKSLRFDLILLDPFSPSKCPQLWSEEFLTNLVNRMAPEGRLTTYCRAAAIRSSLRKAGLELMSLSPEKKGGKDWSNGTLALLPGEEGNNHFSAKGLRPLTKMEEEHLLTKAAIPYRDPSGEGTALEILQRRRIEQQSSTLENTKNWKKRWFNLQTD